MGFMSLVGSLRQAIAWKACPIPISDPSLVAMEFRERLDPLNGTVSIPLSDRYLQNTADSSVLPALDDVPRNINFI